MSELNIYDGSAWVQVGSNDHNSLSFLTSGDPHTQYLLKAGGEMSGNITMAGTETVDGRDVSVDGTTLDNHIASSTAHFTAESLNTQYLPLSGGVLTGNVNSSFRVSAANVDVVTGLTVETGARSSFEDGIFSCGSGRIKVVGDPTVATDAATAGWASGSPLMASLYLPTSGGTLAGNLDMGSNDIITEGNIDGRDVGVDGTAQDNHIASSTVHFTQADIALDASVITFIDEMGYTTSTNMEDVIKELYDLQGNYMTLGYRRSGSLTAGQTIRGWTDTTDTFCSMRVPAGKKFEVTHAFMSQQNGSTIGEYAYQAGVVSYDGDESSTPILNQAVASGVWVSDGDGSQEHTYWHIGWDGVTPLVTVTGGSAIRILPSFTSGATSAATTTSENTHVTIIGRIVDA